MFDEATRGLVHGCVGVFPRDASALPI